MKNKSYIIYILFLISFLNSYCFSQSNNYARNIDKLTLERIKTTLDSVFDEDQKYRNSEQKEISANDIKKMESADKANFELVSEIIDEYGWLGTSQIGSKANSALFLVLQHTDVKNQEKYFEVMKKAVENGNARLCDLALLEDRILMFSNKKQKYGSQIIYDQEISANRIYAIEDEINVDERRKAAGLEPLVEYAKQFGIIYQYDAMQNEKKFKEKSNIGTYVLALIVIILLSVFIMKFINNPTILTWLCFYGVIYLLCFLSLISDINDPMLPSSYNSFNWLLSITIDILILALITSLIRYTALKLINKYHLILDLLSFIIGFSIVSAFVFKLVNSLFFKGTARVFGFNIVALIFLVLVFLGIRFIVSLLQKRSVK